MSVKLHHEGLAEAHDFVVRLAFGVEVGTAFASPHGQSGQSVLEHLFEGQEFEDAEIDGGVKPDSSLVGTDGAVHLNSEAPVDMNLSLVIHPGNLEHDHPLRLNQPLQDP